MMNARIRVAAICSLGLLFNITRCIAADQTGSGTGITYVPSGGLINQNLIREASNNEPAFWTYIASPAGSADKTGNTAEWLKAKHRWDFQGVISGLPAAQKPYRIFIKGKVGKAGSATYKWTLDAGAGALNLAATATPQHVPPAAAGDGVLTLYAMNGTSAHAPESKTLRIYKDHLARDIDNFIVGQKCIAGTWTTPYGPITEVMWNCHGSAWHAYDGTHDTAADTDPLPWKAWNVKQCELVTHTPTGNGSHPVLNNLKRGDVVCYYSPNGQPYLSGGSPDPSKRGSWQLQHSQTCTGNGNETFGANNKPMKFPGRPGPPTDPLSCESWEWAISLAGDWANKVMYHPALAGRYIPFIIVVYEKP